VLQAFQQLRECDRKCETEVSRRLREVLRERGDPNADKIACYMVPDPSDATRSRVCLGIWLNADAGRVKTEIGSYPADEPSLGMAKMPYFLSWFTGESRRRSGLKAVRNMFEQRAALYAHMEDDAAAERDEYDYAYRKGVTDPLTKAFSGRS
jgi:hypothetical protein